MQELFGLSYKDAAHRLYHSEVQKMLLVDVAKDRMQKIRHHNDWFILNRIGYEIATIDALED